MKKKVVQKAKAPAKKAPKKKVAKVVNKAAKALQKKATAKKPKAVKKPSRGKLIAEPKTLIGFLFAVTVFSDLEGQPSKNLFFSATVRLTTSKVFESITPRVCYALVDEMLKTRTDLVPGSQYQIAAVSIYHPTNEDEGFFPRPIPVPNEKAAQEPTEAAQEESQSE